MIDGKVLVEKLIAYASVHLDLKERDEYYVRNLLLREFKCTEPITEKPNVEFVKNYDVPDELVKQIELYAIENGLVEEGYENLYSTHIFGMLTPLPSMVNKTFNAIKAKKGSKQATDYLYNLSIKNNYVQKTAISKNLKWDYKDGDRCLEITINLSKPEKDNKEIAKLLSLPKSNSKYPACMLCRENEGFMGSLTYPARQTLRTVSLALGGEPWFIQYSPYGYYNEHIIAVSEKHAPMHVKEDTIEKLLDFVDYFPHYMIGSNASLPIIGGSILNHEHFQGGGHLMPMHKAPYLKMFSAKGYKKVKIGIVDWYNSVIRLESKNRAKLSELAKKIIFAWENHTDESVGVISETEGVRHNSLSPVVRKDGEAYIIDMILRNNLTTEEFPDGVFHAHPEYHNIKKEGIGLIEAMGLFILPGRLKKQLNEVADILCENKAYNEEELSNPENPMSVHKEMIKLLLEEGKAEDFESAIKRVLDRVNEVCKNILYNTAVFKKDNEGFKAFVKFLSKIDCHIIGKK